MLPWVIMNLMWRGVPYVELLLRGGMEREVESLGLKRGLCSLYSVKGYIVHRDPSSGLNTKYVMDLSVYVYMLCTYN